MTKQEFIVEGHLALCAYLRNAPKLFYCPVDLYDLKIQKQSF